MTEDETRQVIACDGEITVASADELHDRLCRALTDGRPIEVDLSEASVVDVSIVQLLIAARASAERRGVVLTLRKPAGLALLETLRRGGFLSDPPSPDNDFWIGGM